MLQVRFLNLVIFPTDKILCPVLLLHLSITFYYFPINIIALLAKIKPHLQVSHLTSYIIKIKILPLWVADKSQLYYLPTNTPAQLMNAYILDKSMMLCSLFFSILKPKKTLQAVSFLEDSLPGVKSRAFLFISAANQGEQCSYSEVFPARVKQCSLFHEY